jgi:hypothetical protein
MSAFRIFWTCWCIVCGTAVLAIAGCTFIEKMQARQPTTQRILLDSHERVRVSRISKRTDNGTHVWRFACRDGSPLACVDYGSATLQCECR